jgi:hypothetical protein
VDRVPDLVALADPDQITEVVGEDAEVVAMVLDVGGEKRGVAPAENDLLAPIRGLPVHFHVQFVGLDQARRPAESLPDLGQEDHQPVSAGAIAPEPRIGLRRATPRHTPPDQIHGRRRVPGLGRQR